MTSTLNNIRLGLTAEHPCNYLPDQQERIAIAIDDEIHNSLGYEALMANGFRRSGAMIYRPFCDHCQACIPIRITTSTFTPTRSQKRILSKAKNIRWEMKEVLDDSWFGLYSRYITKRHRNGSMYPPKEEDFSKFASTEWLTTGFLHLYEDEQLIGIAVTDIMAQASSAFYTFFDPDHPLSLGTLAVLYQVEWSQKNHKPLLYLGYQVDECPAMNYKTRFKPHQKLVNQSWQG